MTQSSLSERGPSHGAVRTGF